DDGPRIVHDEAAGVEDPPGEVVVLRARQAFVEAAKLEQDVTPVRDVARDVAAVERASLEVLEAADQRAFGHAERARDAGERRRLREDRERRLEPIVARHT